MTSLKDRAQELLFQRLDVMDALEEATARAAHAEAELTAARAAVTATWSAATQAGWTAAELRQLGVGEPTEKRRPARSKPAPRPVATAPKPAQATPAA